MMCNEGGLCICSLHRLSPMGAIFGGVIFWSAAYRVENGFGDAALIAEAKGPG